MAVQLDLYDDHVEETRLVEEAGQRDPASNDRRIRAFIAARIEGVSAALALLADDVKTLSHAMSMRPSCWSRAMIGTCHWSLDYPVRRCRWLAMTREKEWLWPTILNQRCRLILA